MSLQYPSLSKAVSLGTGTLASPTWAAIDADTILDIEATYDLDAHNSSCTVTLGALPAGVDEGQFLLCAGGIDGSTTLFNGEIDDLEFPGDGTVKLRGTGFLARLDQEWGDIEYSYTEQLASAVLRNLIEKSGVPSSLHSVQESDWTLGVAQALLLRPGDVPLQLARQIVDAHLWWLAERSNGAIYAGPIALSPPVASFAYGGRPVLSVTRTRTRRGLRNSIAIEGLPDGAGIAVTSQAQAPSIWVPDPPTYWQWTLRSPLIEDQTTADARAAAALALYNVRPEEVIVTTRLAGGVEVGDTITVTSGPCQLDAVAVFVTGVTLRLRSGTRELRCQRIPA